VQRADLRIEVRIANASPLVERNDVSQGPQRSVVRRVPRDLAQRRRFAAARSPGRPAIVARPSSASSGMPKGVVLPSRLSTSLPKGVRWRSWISPKARST
jgi:hypothetical protein